MLSLSACADAPPPTDNGASGPGINPNPPGTNPPSSECSDRCIHGERICLDDITVLNCVRNERGCLDFGSPSTCPSGRGCQNGSCVSGDSGCDDLCGLGDGPRCNLTGQVETCADHNQDGCRTYGGAQSCAQGQACDPSNGRCVEISCDSSCQIGQTRCDRHRISSCQEDSQGCFGFWASKECPEGQTCVNDTCQVASSCADQCVDNDGICTGDGKVRLCGVWDASGCTTFSDPIECFPNEECRDGDCVIAATCVDECIAGEQVCIGNNIARCADHNGNGCTSFNDPAPCQAPGTTCQRIGSDPASCRPAPGGGVVLINEVFYDPLGHDLRGTGANNQCLTSDVYCTSPTFVELYGTPGMSLAGFHIEFINGTTGAIYNEALLPDNARLDGNGFAVLAMDQPDDRLLYDVPFYTNVYPILESFTSGQDAIQNGDGSVVLYDRSNNVADAMGWGTFAVNASAFKGKGTPAQSATAGRSIGRIPTRANTNDNAADFRTYYPTPGLPNQDLFINEVYTNQPGTNNGSEVFVEIAAPFLDWEDIPLEGYVLRGISGSGQDYLFTPPLAAPGVHLTGRLHGANRRPGYGLICHENAGTALRPNCNILYSGVPFYTGPDSFVLEHRGRIIDAIGYGSFGAQDVFKGEGQAAPYRSQDAGKALGRWPLTDFTVDVDTDNNRNDFHLVSPSPGRTNPRP
jgi:hypothetical protein